MAYRVVVPTGRQEGQEWPLSTPESVEQLITVLSEDDVYSATIAEDDDAPALEVQVYGGYGYLLYAGDALPVHSVGDPDSPALTQVSAAEFPSGSGLSLDAFRGAVMEFLETGGGLPGSVRWREVELE